MSYMTCKQVFTHRDFGPLPTCGCIADIRYTRIVSNRCALTTVTTLRVYRAAVDNVIAASRIPCRRSSLGQALLHVRSPVCKAQNLAFQVQLFTDSESPISGL